MVTSARCPSCAGRDLLPVYTVRDVPVHNSLVFRSREEARALARGDLEIVFCEKCGFIFNAAFDFSLLRYDSTYEDQQAFSPTFERFSRQLATELIDRYALRGKTIVEIGCGKGDFLSALCALGDNRGIGIDPTALYERLDDKVAGKVMFVRELYSVRHARYGGDFTCCRHTLEHIAEVADFMATVSASVKDRPETGVFFELPDVTRVLREAAYWDIYYEHCSYFDPGSLARLFRASGFDVTGLRRGYDDQYLLIDARPHQPCAVSAEGAVETSVAQLRAAVSEFSERVAAIVEEWRRHFEVAAALGTRIAIWGSGSKCVAFLTKLDFELDDVIIVDINPHRHGKFIPGLGMEIFSPDVLKEFGPDEVIVMNKIYMPEIAEDLTRMRVRPRLIAADRAMDAAV